MQTAPFPPDYRASGVLLHVTCLPSQYGIGDVGPAAYQWIDQLVQAGQSWWQVLPLGPTGYGNSPYQSLSSFAGNTLLISPEGLIQDGLLQPSDCVTDPFPTNDVDFNRVIPYKRELLDLAWMNFAAGARRDLGVAFEYFRRERAYWLDDYALFMALKDKFGGAAYRDWPAELVRREPAALAALQRELAEEIDRYRFGQFLIQRQWAALKEYAHSRGVYVLGDLPIFVSPDSADVWANPEFFLLDEDRRPHAVAGVPPDYFSPQGQLWGNPLYDWPALQHMGYFWWIRRLRAVLAYLDVIRLDHFRGFEAAWYVPAEAETAQQGEWVPGPGGDFFEKVRDALQGLPFVAEDLGLITDEVRLLRDQFHLPGMRVLQFAFDGDPANAFLPHNFAHEPNSVVYTGTHDNDTTRGWYRSLDENQRQSLWNYLGRPPGGDEEIAWDLTRLAMQSAAALSVVPLQDLLNLGPEARMNRPGEPAGNWSWRFTGDMVTDEILQRLDALTSETNRRPQNRS